MPGLPTDFAPVDFDRPVDLETYLHDCPATATTRGTFFEYVAQLSRRADGTVDERVYEGVNGQRWTPFKAYPLPDFMRLCFNTTRLVYPGLSSGEALRRIGWLSYPSFAATMAGRVVLFALGQRLDDVLRAAPKSYAHGLPGSSARVTSAAPHHLQIEYRDVYSFASTYHVGVAEGAIKAFGATPDIRIRLLPRRSDVDLDVRW